jgi:hypothetical protein
MLPLQPGGPKITCRSTVSFRPQRAACEANDERAAKLAPIIKSIQAKGVTSLNGIAEALNKRRVPTPRGRGRWYATQVRRLLARLPTRYSTQKM